MGLCGRVAYIVVEQSYICLLDQHFKTSSYTQHDESIVFYIFDTLDIIFWLFTHHIIYIRLHFIVTGRRIAMRPCQLMQCHLYTTRKMQFYLQINHFQGLA